MTDNAPSLEPVPGDVFRDLERGVQRVRPDPALQETGFVREVGRGIARVTGLSGVRDQEVIEFPDGLVGLAIDLAETGIGVALLGDHTKLELGKAARRTGRALDVPVGDALLGRIVDGVGRPIDRNADIRTVERWPIERAAPPIIARAAVTTPLQTGIKAIDAAIPIGRGQRQLIVGDRQSGKTSIAIDALINQREAGVIGIYCAIGQRTASVARVVAILRDSGMLERCIVVVASGDDAPGLQFVAPYAATTMAEFFMERGQDVLVVYDDLTRHARTYRELSLLLRRPPGREAYPGDIFFVHARLLERATHLADAHGGGSLTALPIVETQAQNITAYIPTNLISITDGQVYLSPDLFHKGQLPAIDVGRSVSRVGGKAQLPAYRSIASDLRLSYAQFEEFEAFARFGTRLDPQTRQALERGRRVREILKQPEHAARSVFGQIAVLHAATQGWLDGVAVEAIEEAEARILRQIAGDSHRIAGNLAELRERLERGQRLTAADHEQLRAAVNAALAAPFDGGARH
jgi:F-type H+-transporting ATPase subunit alpha